MVNNPATLPRIDSTSKPHTSCTTPGSSLSRWSQIPPRLILGFGFMAHGVAKLERGPDAFVGVLHALNVPAPHLMAWVTILIELLGGLAILSGALVRWVSLPMIVVLLTAIFTVHLPFGFSSIKLEAVTAAGPQFGPPGYECDLLYLACIATLMINGAGPFSLDGILKRSCPRWLWLGR
jgi:putative oxidoreductase